MLQVDGSPHDWLEGRGPQITLLGFQDDATSKVVGAEFFPTETAYGYFRVFRGVLRRYGVPLSLYGDRCGIFVRNDEHWTLEEELTGRQHPVRPRAPAARHHLHPRLHSAGQGAHRTHLGRLPGPPAQRTASGRGD